ncbi:LysM peptidoglycan-binding domain-containing protein [Bifidobacterium catenulatum]|uniref:LysM peptidoglycan-binding domain-containing protein n=1 Tax=Bifidobacterium catenulatum subsp. kashiwanohense TaxID=630129 RepID=A0AA43P756_9BIFI|nr:LysM peptidoglycan-binding domain-containing protein [Bifidobacterium catenulatum]MDH7873108.1 LysM peptidoglycan-binding domain-containing protein [Bifidobacterium catenulatum subsp. kashiwanohense]MDH7880491.1 LysM peptidoglycan-binding domain-containing protein [Bifidobacterium catenulatum subsp. kashiwanohense]MDH7885951.1 LysM peptidoglycan-binding domain-containing protein [Bifidobacterium catenulatum subsp. kashiwanohense]MDH7890039.1 LysM peptidoglycan-binding domain-containing prote
MTSPTKRHQSHSNWIRVFVNRVHERTGVWPLGYVSAAFIPQIPADVRANCGLWVAQYANNNPTGWQPRPWNYGKYGEAMRQYTSNGRINGYNGPLDLNYFRGIREQWDKYANPSKTAKPSPTPAPQPAPSVDYEALATATIRGDYGNGEARKAALGANYGPVMRIVNQRLDRSAAYATAASTRSVSVTVRSGDTMSGIAKRTGLWPVTAWSVPSGNINLIYPGNVVTYQGAATAASSGSAATGGRVHVVKSGETLSGIFGANGCQRVAQLNNLANPNLIYPGQRLRY